MHMRGIAGLSSAASPMRQCCRATRPTGPPAAPTLCAGLPSPEVKAFGKCSVPTRLMAPT